MTDGPESLRKATGASSDRQVEDLASKALDVLAQRRVTKPKVMTESHIEALRTGVIARAAPQHSEAVTAMRRAGISTADIVDHYIPEVARRLGEEWCSDLLGFAEVTIGSARLQALVRELSAELPLPAADRINTGVAVVVLADNYHTLGAMILTTQLRRLGVSVRLLMGATHQDALQELERDRYDAIMISASHTEGLDKLAKLVEKIRRQTKRDTPIVIGGPVVRQSIDVRKLTGADFATSDVHEAIRVCRLKTYHAAFTATKENG